MPRKTKAKTERKKIDLKELKKEEDNTNDLNPDLFPEAQKKKITFKVK